MYESPLGMIVSVQKTVMIVPNPYELTQACQYQAISDLLILRQDHDQVTKCGAKMVKNEVDNRELKMNSTKQPTFWP